MTAIAQMSVQDQLHQLLSERVLLLDGAMGTMIFAHEPQEEDYRGKRFQNHSKELRNCTDVMVLTQPKIVRDIHWKYLEAGSDIVETNTFTANALTMSNFDLQDHVYELNKRAAELAREAVEKMNRRTPDRPRFVAGSIGPEGKDLLFDS